MRELIGEWNYNNMYFPYFEFLQHLLMIYLVVAEVLRPVFPPYNFDAIRA
jgi:hypothetical protein